MYLWVAVFIHTSRKLPGRRRQGEKMGKGITFEEELKTEIQYYSSIEKKKKYLYSTDHVKRYIDNYNCIYQSLIFSIET